MDCIRFSWDLRKCSRLGVGGACVLLATTAMGQSYINLTAVTVTKGGISLDPWIAENWSSPAYQLNGAIYTRNDASGSSGSGTYVRLYGVQKTGVEQGYNYEGTSRLPFDQKTGGFNPYLTMSMMRGRFINGQLHYEFSLDINQNTGGTSEFLSLDRVMVFTSPTSPLLVTDAASLNYSVGTSGALGYKRYDSGTGNAVLMDYSLRTGSGTADMFLYLPATMFSGALPTDTVYLYGLFGGFTGAVSGGTEFAWGGNDGFEEWALDPNTPLVPEPREYAVMAALLCGAYAFRRRFAGSKS